MARNNTDIVKALNARLLLADNSGFVGNIQFEKATFERPVDEIFLRQTTMFAVPIALTAFADQGTYRTQGIYQIDVIRSKGNGVVEMSVKADIIMSDFKRGTILDSNGFKVNIQKTYRLNTMTDDPYIFIPISVEFWSYEAYDA